MTIKDRTIIGAGCQIATTSHSLNYLDRRRPNNSAKPVEIGEDCWLGIGVTVLPGVKIGKGCVVAAGAVMARDVSPFTLVGGFPAKLIRYLGDPEGLGEGRSDLERKDDGKENSKGSGARETDETEADLPRWQRTPAGLKK